MFLYELLPCVPRIVGNRDCRKLLLPWAAKRHPCLQIMLCLNTSEYISGCCVFPTLPEALCCPTATFLSFIYDVGPEELLHSSDFKSFFRSLIDDSRCTASVRTLASRDSGEAGGG